MIIYSKLKPVDDTRIPDFVDSSGKNYYDTLSSIPTDMYYVAFYEDTGFIRQIETDCTMICLDDGLSVSAIKSIEDLGDKSPNLFTFDGEKFTLNLKRHNESLHRTNMSVANKTISVLSEEKDAGIISEDDLKKWKRWVSYRKELRELDISKEKVDWPKAPE